MRNDPGILSFLFRGNKHQKRKLKSIGVIGGRDKVTGAFKSECSREHPKFWDHGTGIACNMGSGTWLSIVIFALESDVSYCHGNGIPELYSMQLFGEESIQALLEISCCSALQRTMQQDFCLAKLFD